MNKLSIKFISLILLIALNASGFLAIGETLAFFSNNKNSSSNIFQAGVLDMTVRSGQSNFTPNAENMMKGDQVNRDIYIGKTDVSLPLNYNVSFEFISGDIDLCNQLDLKIWYDHYHGDPSGGYANRDMRLKFSGKLSNLTNLVDSDFEIPHPDDRFDTNSSDGTEQWFYYSIILPNDIADSFQGKVCQFNFIYEAWQDNIDNYGNGGFTDVEKIESTVKAGYWNPPVVLNEFLPNAGNYPEFIEIYNKTDLPIDLNGYKIRTDNAVIPIAPAFTGRFSGGNTTIPANGWLVVSSPGNPGSSVPNGWKNFLDDTSGTITLYNQRNVELDSYNYGSPKHNINNTPGETNNLVAYLPFDGDLVDESGNNNNGTNNGAVFINPGKINEGLTFDGDDYIVVDNSLSIEPTFVTLETWVRKSGLPGSYKYIAGKYYSGGFGSYNLYTGSSGGLRFYIGHNGGFVPSPDAGIGVWDGAWHHVVGTYDGSRVKLYVDGGEIDSGTVAGVNIAYNDNKFYIGSYGNGFYFNGDIDEVKVYDRALDATEIGEHYNNVSILSGSVPVDKSYARIPDGTGDWVDPIPTPGEPNKLDIGKIVGIGEPAEEVKAEPIKIDFVENSFVPIVATTTTATTTNFVVDEATSTESATNEATSTVSTTTANNIATTIEEIASSTEVVSVDFTTASSTEDVVLEDTLTVVETTTTEAADDDEVVIIEESSEETEVLKEVIEESVEEIVEETPVIEEILIDENPAIEEKSIALFDGDSAQSEGGGEEPDGEEPLIPN